MPFILNGNILEFYFLIRKFWFFLAVWKIIKALLPAKAVELVQFTDKNSIKKFINEDNLFTHMGGKVKKFLKIFLYSIFFFQDSYEYNPKDYNFGKETKE